MIGYYSKLHDTTTAISNLVSTNDILNLEEIADFTIITDRVLPKDNDKIVRMWKYKHKVF